MKTFYTVAAVVALLQIISSFNPAVAFIVALVLLAVCFGLLIFLPDKRSRATFDRIERQWLDWLGEAMKRCDGPGEHTIEFTSTPLRLTVEVRPALVETTGFAETADEPRPPGSTGSWQDVWNREAPTSNHPPESRSR